MNRTLVVIRSAIPEQLAEFYTHLGLTFEHHRHGNGPYHYSARVGPTLEEIYPLAKGQDKADSTLRLGFAIDFFAFIVEELVRGQVSFHQAPAVT